MGKETLMFGNIEIEKKILPSYRHPLPLGDVDIEKVSVSNTRFLLAKETISTLLVTCTIIIKLSHCI